MADTAKLSLQRPLFKDRRQAATDRDSGIVARLTALLRAILGLGIGSYPVAREQVAEPQSVAGIGALSRPPPTQRKR